MKKALFASLLFLALGGMAVAQSNVSALAAVKKEHKMHGKKHHKHHRGHKHGVRKK